MGRGMQYLCEVFGLQNIYPRFLAKMHIYRKTTPTVIP